MFTFSKKEERASESTHVGEREKERLETAVLLKTQSMFTLNKAASVCEFPWC